MELIHKIFFTLPIVNWVSCTIAGLSYMDPINPLKDDDKKFRRGEDPCNPLYWYPRSIPESCMTTESPSTPKTDPPPPQPVPIPVPMEPYPLPMPVPMPYPDPMPMPYPDPMPMPPQIPAVIPPPPFFPPPPLQPAPIPGPLLPIPAPMPLSPLPYGVPIQPSMPMIPMLGPVLQQPYPMPFYGSRQPYGFVPNVPGLVSRDGGINIMPFSDVYSDLLEKHKQKMIRKEMQKIIAKYNKKYSYKRHGGRRNLYD